MLYPLQFSFKSRDVSAQVALFDAQEDLEFYVKHKFYQRNDSITIFADREKNHPLYYIKNIASNRYDFADADGVYFSSIERPARRSRTGACYDIYDRDTVTLRIKEKNHWLGILNNFFEKIPILGIFATYLFAPVYLVKRVDGTVLVRMRKIPSFLSENFIVHPVNQFSDREEHQALLGLKMMLLLEKNF